MFMVMFISSQVINGNKLPIEYPIFFNVTRVKKARSLVRDAMARYSTYERGVLYKVDRNTDKLKIKQIATISRDSNTRPIWD